MRTKSPFKQKMTIKVYSTPVCDVEFLRFSAKNIELLNTLKTDLYNINKEGLFISFDNVLKYKTSSRYYSFLFNMVEFFETNLWNDFTESELKFKNKLYSSFIKNLTKLEIK